MRAAVLAALAAVTRPTALVIAAVAHGRSRPWPRARASRWPCCRRSAAWTLTRRCRRRCGQARAAGQRLVGHAWPRPDWLRLFVDHARTGLPGGPTLWPWIAGGVLAIWRWPSRRR
jgi:hypothetical protein